MTLEQLCGGEEFINQDPTKPWKRTVAEWLEAMTDAQLEEHFKGYFDVTRPDRESAVFSEKKGAFKGASKDKGKKVSAMEQMVLSLSPEKRAKLEKIATMQGLNLEELLEEI